MSGTSATDDDGVSRRLKNAATILATDNQTLLSDIRKAFVMVKDIAVDLERDNQTEKVKQLEDAVVDLDEQCKDVGRYGAAVQSVVTGYKMCEESTDFKKLLVAEVRKRKRNSSASAPAQAWIRQFREAVWNVHHSGTMPGDTQEDVIMANSQFNFLNVMCPLSGKPISELEEPVRSKECKHIYELSAVKNYISIHKKLARCPIAGCPKMLRMKDVMCDPMLLSEIEELRNTNQEDTRNSTVLDFTALGEDT